ncbi:branched-chain amino acid ABC transporter permease [Iamia sp.]|jgi:branched-chain amino acid transport system permease protein|uniref:branched-chain amino acid ABC transporter permease n=1 Tax=Iamia sp. TaxID=2722710 RepID=UPI002B7D3748|nr:branched-chain amino acid ABC transporter permease [Iamia sp.]HXH56793.1 branched-chain amino acid ABC transporter permease [Iamia sp.]
MSSSDAPARAKTAGGGGGRITRTQLRIGVGVIVAVAALYAPYYYGPAINQDLSRAVYFAIAAMGLNLLTGFNGQISIGHGAFFGVGAFTTAILMDTHDLMFELTIPLAALTAAVLGVLVGIPALRVRGLYLALVTLGLAVLFPFVGLKYIEGNGGTALVRPDRDGFNSLITFLDNDQWRYLESLVVAVVLFLVAWNLTRSRIGRAMVAVRDQEVAASTVGVHLARVKVGVFALSAAYAGVAGALSVMVDGAADATDPVLAFRNSIEFLVAVVIGGTATIAGPAVGALILILLRRETDGLIEGKEVLSPAIFGGALIAMIFVLPEGVVGGLSRLARRVLPDREGGSAASPLGPAPSAAMTNEADEPPTKEHS